MTRVLRACLVVAVLWFLALLSVLHGHARVTIKAPAFVNEPATVKIQITVEPDAANRLLRVVADDGIHFRSSDVDLHGVDGPRTSWIEWRELRAGDYDVQAIVGRADGDVLHARAALHVLGR